MAIYIDGKTNKISKTGYTGTIESKLTKGTSSFSVEGIIGNEYVLQEGSFGTKSFKFTKGCSEKYQSSADSITITEENNNIVITVTYNNKQEYDIKLTGTFAETKEGLAVVNFIEGDLYIDGSISIKDGLVVGEGGSGDIALDAVAADTTLSVTKVDGTVNLINVSSTGTIEVGTLGGGLEVKSGTGTITVGGINITNGNGYINFGDIELSNKITFERYPGDPDYVMAKQEELKDKILIIEAYRSSGAYYQYYMIYLNSLFNIKDFGDACSFGSFDTLNYINCWVKPDGNWDTAKDIKFYINETDYIIENIYYLPMTLNIKIE